ncbi:MAG: CBS domain-containing protein [Methylacidiphilales bacterium]|nr:CBS domain-containing protein [Candidatus Methylacidiphilales bacterium]
MDIILCHTTADFDALGAAVGLSRVKAGCKIVLAGGTHPPVREFLALYRDEFALIERRSVNPQQIRSLTIVDTQNRDRLGKVSEWFDLTHLENIIIYDHHPNQISDISATETHIEAVGATTTLIAELLQKSHISLTSAEATVMALGIHVDTGSLVFDNSTFRDALALGWLMQQGANLTVVNEYLDPGLSPQLQQLLKIALEKLEYLCLPGCTIAWVSLETDTFVPGLSSLASQLCAIAETDVLFLAHEFPVGSGEKKRLNEKRLSIIGRSQNPHVKLNELFQPFGGGGHSQAASLNLRSVNSQDIINQLLDTIKTQIPQPPIARDVMSSPVRSILPEITIESAQRILLRYGYSGLSVVDGDGKLVGIISRRDLDIALHHGFSHAPVKGYMTTNIKTITPDATMPQIEALMVTYDIGRLPVISEGHLVGMVTRTDVLRELYQREEEKEGERKEKILKLPTLVELRSRLTLPLWELLTKASQEAEKRGWHLYLVGGGVRDLLLAEAASGTLLLKDIDLVVDGFQNSADAGAGVELASSLQKIYPSARLDIHGSFQTAALLWHKDPELDSLWVDIATARTEFYPYPAANPEVEASSIRQDLYRRDFTINAIALRLTSPREGELLDFFGGLIDLKAKQIRVLHPNSFIEDPTRIYRGVRFAVRLGFEIEPHTEGYIRYAINSGVYDKTARENSKTPALQTRLKAELKLILEANYWESALELLDNLGALQCIHPTLKLDDELLRQLKLLEKCLQRFDKEQILTHPEGFASRYNAGNPRNALAHWQMRLEVIIAYLAPEYRGKVAKNLQMPDDSIKRLSNLLRSRTQVDYCFSTSQPDSQAVQLLRQYELPTLILIAVQTQRKIRRQIWYYFTELRHIQAPLDGNDLRKIGYKPGPLFRQMLDDLLAATLDGEIKDKADAERFLKNKYPN